ncbi:MAG: META domain-containing protein [Desulfobacterales bacterium]
MRPNLFTFKGTFEAAAILILTVLFGCGGFETTPGNAPEIVTSGNAATLTYNPLADTEWRLVEIRSMDDAVGVVRPDDPSLYTMRLNADGKVYLRLGCNRANGSWTSEPSADPANGRFRFSLLSTNKALCPPPSLDEKIATDTKYVRGYLIRENRLYLSLFADGGIYTWEPEGEARFSKEPDSAIEEAILRASPDYARAVAAIGGTGGRARYIYNIVDLNGDGNQEALVYLLGSIFCCSGGCNLFLFSQGHQEYTLVNNFPISRLPVIVSPQKTNGWNNLIRLESGGGVPPTYVVHAFDGKHYVERQRLPGNDAPKGKRYLAGEFTFQDGIPLEPAK